MPIDLFGTMTSKLFGVLDTELDSGAVDVRDLTGRLALDIVGLAVFGTVVKGILLLNVH